MGEASLLFVTQFASWRKRAGGKCECAEATTNFGTRPGRGSVTVAGKLNDDLARGTWNSIIEQARPER